MSAEENKSIVARFLVNFWAEPNGDSSLDFVDQQASARYASSLTSLRMLRAIPDLRMRIKDMIASGDRVICRMEWSGRPRLDIGSTDAAPPESGEVVEVFRLSAGKIVESWQSWDIASVLRPLGAAREPLLDTTEIQGNVVPGFNKDHQSFLFCEIAHPQKTREWLGRMTAHVATLEELVAFNRLFKKAKKRRGGREGIVKSTWMNLAFTYSGLKKLTSDADLFEDAAFKEGMLARSSSLGDPINNDPGSPFNWKIGGPGRIPDLLIILGSDDSADLASAVRWIQAEHHGALRVVYRQQGNTLRPPLTGHEHFGFLDGISQPGVRGLVSENPDDFLTPRLNPDDVNEGLPGQDLLWPGQFILGYPGSAVSEQAELNAPFWAKNGSFLVFRRYRQDVGALRTFLKKTAANLAQQYPALSTLTPERLGALLMGRWTSGAPVVRAAEKDLPQLGSDDCANNHFSFAKSSTNIGGSHGKCSDAIYPQAPGDVLGTLCPMAAHIRKANPRDDLPLELVNSHRIIRRGIPFTDQKAGESGLLFLCYQASIEQQFEFVVKHWFNNPDLRRTGEGYDPIVGQAAGQQDRIRSFDLAISETGAEPLHIQLELPVEWTLPTGGAYFFAPSISALELIARG